MTEFITDFKSFAADINTNKARKIKFELEDKEYEIKYSELSSGEETKMQGEFARWWKDNHSEQKSSDKEISLQQYRYFKMLQSHVDNLNTFEDFLALPRLVISAMVTAMETDMLEKYPHLKSQFDLSSGF